MGKRREFTMDAKLAALDYLKHHSVERTAKEFKVDTKQIRNWRNREDEIRRLHSVLQEQKNDWREEAGKLHTKNWRSDWNDGSLVRENWENACRERKFNVKPWNCSSRWSRSTKPNHHLLQVIVGSQSSSKEKGLLSAHVQQYVQRLDPSDCAEKVVRFLLFLRKIRQQYSDSSIFVMDETPVWLEPVGTTTVEMKCAKQVPIKTTGHEKVRFIYCYIYCPRRWYEMQTISVNSTSTTNLRARKSKARMLKGRIPGLRLILGLVIHSLFHRLFGMQIVELNYEYLFQA